MDSMSRLQGMYMYTCKYVCMHMPTQVVPHTFNTSLHAFSVQMVLPVHFSAVWNVPSSRWQCVQPNLLAIRWNMYICSCVLSVCDVNTLMCHAVYLSIYYTRFFSSSTANVRIWALQNGWHWPSGGRRGEASQPTIDLRNSDGGEHVCNSLPVGHEVFLLWWQVNT